MENHKEQTLEEVFHDLEQVMDEMEKNDITLEDSFKKYQQGMELLKSCNEKIDLIEKKMLILNENGETDEF